jgi:hypothetical protein
MDRKPKARSPAKRTAKAAKKKEETQKERFIKAARSIGVDETGEEFNAALAKVTRPTKRNQRQG